MLIHNDIFMQMYIYMYMYIGFLLFFASCVYICDYWYFTEFPSFLMVDNFLHAHLAVGITFFYLNRVNTMYELSDLDMYLYMYIKGTNKRWRFRTLQAMHA